MQNLADFRLGTGAGTLQEPRLSAGSPHDFYNGRESFYEWKKEMLQPSADLCESAVSACLSAAERLTYESSGKIKPDQTGPDRETEAAASCIWSAEGSLSCLEIQQTFRSDRIKGNGYREKTRKCRHQCQCIEKRKTSGKTGVQAPGGRGSGGSRFTWRERRGIRAHCGGWIYGYWKEKCISDQQDRSADAGTELAEPLSS